MKKEILFTLGEVARTPNFWLMTMGYLVLAMCYGFLLHVVAYCVDIGISASDAAWALGYMAMVGIAARFLWAPLNDKLNNRKVSVVSGFFLYALGWLVFLFINKSAHLYIAATILGLGGSNATNNLGIFKRSNRN